MQMLLVAIIIAVVIVALISNNRSTKDTYEPTPEKENEPINTEHDASNQTSSTAASPKKRVKLPPRAFNEKVETSPEMLKLKRQAKKELSDKSYGLYRCTLFAQSNVFRNAEDYYGELELLLQVCFIDYYGYENGGTQRKSDSLFAPAILYRIKHSPAYKELGENAEEFYFQSIRKLPADFTQKSRPHFSFVKTVEAVADYKEYNERE